MKKTTVRTKLNKLVEKLGDLRADFSDLKAEMDETIENIKPYKNRKSLTHEQMRRRDYFEDIADTIGDLVREMQSAEWNLED